MRIFAYVAAAAVAAAGAVPAAAAAMTAAPGAVTAGSRPPANRDAARAAAAQAGSVRREPAWAAPARAGLTAALAGRPATAGLTGRPGTAALAARTGAAGPDGTAGPGRTAGPDGTPATAGVDECSAAYYRGNALLGPALLPKIGAVGRELAGYRRTGGMPAARFLDKFYNPVAKSWVYPPDDGFVTKPGGPPQEAVVRLYVGQYIDRFGSEFGSFLSPAGLPYSARSIPPSNLDGHPAGGCNYHEYRVLRSFPVEAGAAAPWFRQPGGGTQYLLSGPLIPGAPGDLSVMWLLTNKYLEPVFQRTPRALSGRAS